jgi:protein subunit release factor B
MSAPAVPVEELRRSYRLPESDEELLAECDVTAFRSSGPGGQHRNKTLTSIRLHHRPSGLVVIGRRERSQTRNLNDAVRRLREKLKTLLTPSKARVKTRPGRAAKERRLEEKRRRSRTKEARGRFEGTDGD